jgi:hypothetical protein
MAIAWPLRKADATQIVTCVPLASLSNIAHQASDQHSKHLRDWKLLRTPAKDEPNCIDIDGHLDYAG